MPSASDRLDFGPPKGSGSVRAFTLALLVHALLIAALTWGVNWKRSDLSAGYEAELWAAAPQQAAPRLIETPPEPTPQTVTPPQPPQPPPAAPVLEKADKPAFKAPSLPPPAEVDIALEREKKRQQIAREKEADAQKEATAALAKKQKDLRAKQQQASRAAEAEAQAAIRSKEAEKLQARQQTQQQALLAEQKRRQENINRTLGQAGLAGANGSANDTGSALKSAGPSASYGGVLRAAIRPNVVFTEEIVGNPMATVEVRVTSDGTIISQRLVKSSGNKNWDDAAVNAIIRTRVMPKDVDGRMPDTILIIDMRARG